MPPLPGSPAIDTGGTSTLTTDQRGFPRIDTPDIGATEYRGNTDLVQFWKLDFDGDSSPFGTEQALGTDPLVSDPANSRNITAPILNASGHPVLSFGIGAAAPGTSWVLCRSTDLLLFTEIYRYDGSTDTAAPGVTFPPHRHRRHRHRYHAAARRCLLPLRGSVPELSHCIRSLIS
jgi:hypothetical protein